MKVSGFTICRNILKYDYPVIASLKSLLPLVDELIVNVGKSDDGTLDLIRSLRDPKIRILETDWDAVPAETGWLLSAVTNVALRECRGDWAIYLQADEVLHERDYPRIRGAMARWAGDPSVKGLTVRYHHFWGDYWTTHPWRYRWHVRIVRPGGSVESYKDACGFWYPDRTLPLKDGPRSAMKPTGAWGHHYGWVHPPAVMLEKKGNVEMRIEGEEAVRSRYSGTEWHFPKSEYKTLKRFRGPHPAPMAEYVARMPGRLYPDVRSRWLNPEFWSYTLRHGIRL